MKNHPWGPGDPPAGNCWLCHKRIGARATHHVSPDHYWVLCRRCWWRPDIHRVMFPDCTKLCLDDNTHGVILCTRGGVYTELARQYERMQQ